MISGSSARTCAARHAGPHARVIQNVENVLVVDVEEAHLHVVVEHGPGHLVGVVDRPERLQQFLIGAVVEDEIAAVGDEKHVRMHDAQLGILAESREALRLERFLNPARAVAPVSRAQASGEVALARAAAPRRWRPCGPASSRCRGCATRLLMSATMLGDLRAAVGPGAVLDDRRAPARRICGCRRRARQCAFRRRTRSGRSR